MFLSRIDFYGTLLTRFKEYILTPLQTHFSTKENNNLDFIEIQAKMKRNAVVLPFQRYYYN